MRKTKTPRETHRTVEFRKPCRPPRKPGFYFGKYKFIGTDIVPLLVVEWDEKLDVFVGGKELSLKSFTWFGSVPECREREEKR